MNRFGKTLIGMASASATLIFAATPSAAGDAAGEITIAAQHADLAAGASDITGVRMHLHHALNCIEGPNGADFSKTDMNPCASAGAGAIPDSGNPTTTAALQTAVVEAVGGLSATTLATAQSAASKTAATLKSIK
jgi:hypothetical protein